MTKSQLTLKTTFPSGTVSRKGKKNILVKVRHLNQPSTLYMFLFQALQIFKVVSGTDRRLIILMII